MNQLSSRHSEILNILAQRGYMSIEEMAVTFDVTPQTLRRDLQLLADRGLLRRHHGGASADISTANLDYGQRHVEMPAAKVAIGRAAAELVMPGSSLFLTPGTTVDALARAIADRRPSSLRVVTNSTVAASLLERCPDVSIHLTGGIWLRRNRSLGGLPAVAPIENYRCDLCLTSIGAVDADGNLLEYREEDVVVMRAMFRNARRRVLLADHTKFARVATSRLAHLKEVSTLVTDRAPEPAVARMLDAAGCEVIVAGTAALDEG